MRLYTDFEFCQAKTRDKLPVSCQFCDLKFLKQKGEIKDNRQNFCSHSCRAKYQNPLRKEIKYCKFCSKILSTKKKVFCNHRCNISFEYETNISNWISGKLPGYSGKTFQISKYIRKFLFQKYNSQCSKCSWCAVHPISNRIPLEINHIDGDASNCKEENLELLCPNCHSLTSNFRSLNKGSVRNRKSPQSELNQ